MWVIGPYGGRGFTLPCNHRNLTESSSTMNYRNACDLAIAHEMRIPRYSGPTLDCWLDRMAWLQSLCNRRAYQYVEPQAFEAAIAEANMYVC